MALMYNLLDEILMIGQSFQEHMVNLKGAGLRLKPKNCCTNQRHTIPVDSNLVKAEGDSSPSTNLPQFLRNFILEMDASGSGLGAVLAKEQEAGYAGRTLQNNEKNHGVKELEA